MDDGKSKAMRNLDCSCVCRLNSSSPQSTVQILFFLGGKVILGAASLARSLERESVDQSSPAQKIERIGAQSSLLLFLAHFAAAGEIKSKMAWKRANKIKKTAPAQIGPGCRFWQSLSD